MRTVLFIFFTFFAPEEALAEDPIAARVDQVAREYDQALRAVLAHSKAAAGAALASKEGEVERARKGCEDARSDFLEKNLLRERIATQIERVAAGPRVPGQQGMISTLEDAKRSVEGEILVILRAAGTFGAELTTLSSEAERLRREHERLLAEEAAVTGVHRAELSVEADIRLPTSGITSATQTLILPTEFGGCGFPIETVP